MFCCIVVRMKKQELWCWIVYQIFSSHNAKPKKKLIFRKVCRWCLIVKVIVSVQRKIYIVKKRCSILLPALINEYNISSITSCSILTSSTHYTWDVYTPVFYRSADFGFHLRFNYDVNSARKGITRSQQQQQQQQQQQITRREFQSLLVIM